MNQKELKTKNKPTKLAWSERSWTIETTQVYGSLGYQLREASDESQSLAEFIWQVLKIFGSAPCISLVLGALFGLTLFMCYFGVKYLNACPLKKEIPIYLLVGGTTGMLMVTVLYLKHRRLREDDDSLGDDEPAANGDVRHTNAYTGTSVWFVEALLALFLVAWFIAGNCWVFSIYMPPFSQPLRSSTPTIWCDRTVYLFSLAQISIIHGLAALALLTVAFSLCCAHRLSRNSWV